MALNLPSNLDYSHGAQMTDDTNVHEVRMEGSISVRSESTPYPQGEVWQVTWKQVTYAEKESLKTVFRASNGIFAINFTPPQAGASILVVSENAQYRHVGYDNWDVQVTFRQVYDDE